MTNFLTDDQIRYIVHGYDRRTISHSIFIINLIIAEQLSERERLSLRLRFHKGMVYREIADILGISMERSRQIVFKSLSIIRDLYPSYKERYLIA